MLIKKLTLIALLIMSVAGMNFAATYYVNATSGNDANSGTSTSSPWKTISKVNSKSFSPGDNILFMRGGTWATGTLNITSSGTSSSPIVYGAYGTGNLPIIDGKNAGFCALISSKNYITIENIKFQNAAGEGTIRVNTGVGIKVLDCTFYLTAHGSVFIQNSSNCLISGITVTTPTFLDVQTDGIYSQRNTNNIYEKNHIVISNTETTNHDDCIQSYEDNNLTVRDNYLEQSNTKPQNAQGIYMTDGIGTFTVYNNVVKCPHNQANIIGFDNDVSGTASLVLYNNTVIGGGANTLRIPHKATVTVKNNVFVTTYSSTLIQLSTLGSGSTFDYNIYYRQDGNSSIIGYSGSKTLSQWKALGYDAHSLNANPMLNDSLYPSTTAPEINKGVVLGGVYSTDKEGTTRPQGVATDMGAYEIKAALLVKTVTNNTPTDFPSANNTESTPSSVVNSYQLSQNFPNPFNPSTVIKYSVGDAAHVTINVYDITGRMVRELVNEDKAPGEYNVQFKGDNLASGTYIYMIKAGNFTKTNKMILLK